MDLSVAVGLTSPGATEYNSTAPELGTFIKNFDLDGKGLSHTVSDSSSRALLINHRHSHKPNNFTLQIPLPSSRFIFGARDYVITTAVTNAIGVGPLTSLLSLDLSYSL